MGVCSILEVESGVLLCVLMELSEDLCLEWWLPGTTIHQIFQWLSGKECERCACVAKNWRSAAEHDDVREKVTLVALCTGHD